MMETAEYQAKQETEALKRKVKDLEAKVNENTMEKRRAKLGDHQCGPDSISPD